MHLPGTRKSLECSSPAASEGMRNLKQEIIAARKQSAIGGDEWFLPFNVVEDLTTRELVLAEIEAAGIADNLHAPLADFVLKDAKRVFLMLVWSEEVGALPDLYDEGFSDHHLPIGLEQGSVGSSRKFQYIVRSWNESSTTLKPQQWAAFSTWKNKDLEHFEKGQWHFLLAPKFEKQRFQYRLHPKRPLPFLSKTNFLEKVGFFSRVYQVGIHDAHHEEAKGDGKLLVAVKELLPGMESYYQKELDTLAVIRKLNHPHLIKPIATYQRGEAHCFIFPWADGDNLRKFWRETDNPSQARIQRTPDLVLWVLKQMRGLADGLHALHDKNCRHGDLKPENVLRFTNEGGRGILLIADMGLAKFHIVATRQRDAKSSTSEATFRYAPPEIVDNRPDKPLSRAYDIWSMGCIYLEFLIWILGGQAWLQEFNTVGGGGFEKFWELKDKQYQVHGVVTSWIDTLSKRLRCYDKQSETALKHVLQLVEKRLLLVRLEGEGVPEGEARANANELFKSVGSIYDRAMLDQDYLFDASIWRQNRASIPGSLALPMRSDVPRGFVTSLPRAPSDSNDDNDFQLHVYAAPDESSNMITSRQAIQETLQIADLSQPQLSKLNDVWESSADNEFARQLFSQIDWTSLQTSSRKERLCEKCQNLDLWLPGFKLCYEVPDLNNSQEKCDLCSLLHQSIANPGINHKGQVQFYRVESTFRTEPGGPPVLSIYVDPESENPPSLAQLGFPVLPEHGSPIQFALLNEWLRVCDETHDCQIKQAKEGINALPTRVIDVGDQQHPRLRLLDGNSGRQGRYVALSHRWGKLDEAEKFCTYDHNIANFRKGIEFDLLPKTFQDAVRITRGLKIQFLWIDSLCIIQDNPSDWETESERMEDVFSSAYCTIAASSANSSVDGFLGARKQRECVTLSSAKFGTLYVCKAIDNFQEDVERSELNKRGWVLQERALSRRTIHFTTTQVYWECGKYVHCETLAKLRNSKAAFLGDADFPNSALGYSKGGRIVLFQSLYEMYSGLAFTKDQDRSVAISGLEKRLVRTFSTKGGNGVFEAYLARGLLWQRPEGRTLTRINYPENLHVPSWSWMAYSGPISYITIPFDGADWTNDFRTPFKPETPLWSKRNWGEDGRTSAMDLEAFSRKMIMLDRVEMLKRVRFEESSDVDIESLRCVVIGKEKLEGSSDRDPMRYVLIITPTFSKGSTDHYERVGAGYLQSIHIAETGAWIRIS